MLPSAIGTLARRSPSLLLCVTLAALVAACRGNAGAPTPELRKSSASTADGATGRLPGRGEACPDGRCADDLTCLRYFGIAGPSGPELSSCERPCPEGVCPSGEVCATVADGPGRVCQPRS